MSKERALIIGLNPELINFSDPEYAAFPGLNAEKIMQGLISGVDSLVGIGLEAEICLIDFGKTANNIVKEKLLEKHFDYILIGAGVRTVKGNFLLFEQIINTVHEYAPKSRICFNTNPNDTAEAIERWIKK